MHVAAHSSVSLQAFASAENFCQFSAIVENRSLRRLRSRCLFIYFYLQYTAGHIVGPKLGWEKKNTHTGLEQTRHYKQWIQFESNALRWSHHTPLQVFQSAIVRGKNETSMY